MHSPPSALAMRHLLSTTTTLRSLAIDLLVQLDDTDQRLWAEGFANNRSLQTLHFCWETAEPMAQRIFPLLSAHPTLRNVSLQSSWSTTSMECLMSTTSTLQDLHFSEFSFTDTEMQQLVHALTAHSCVSTLQLSWCKLDANASQRFIPAFH
jgi:hypothetical protein